MVIDIKYFIVSLILFYYLNLQSKELTKHLSINQINTIKKPIIVIVAKNKKYRSPPIKKERCLITKMYRLMERSDNFLGGLCGSS